MLQKLERDGTCNRILHELSDDDFNLIREHLSPVALPVRKRLEAPNKSIGKIYFLDSGIASVIATGPQDCSMCVGLVGSEGVTGVPVFLGLDRSPNETVVQFAGTAQEMPTEVLQQAIAKSDTLHEKLLSYSHAFAVQVAQTALANGWNTIEERLARWLCMAHDRSDGEELNVTHERLGELLGVRRPAITLALARLEQDRSIHVRRGTIAIADRLRLEQKTGGMYGRSEREFERLFTPATAPSPWLGTLDLDYYLTQRAKSLARIGAAEARLAKHKAGMARLGDKAPILHNALTAELETSLDLMRRHLARVERAIELERTRRR